MKRPEKIPHVRDSSPEEETSHSSEKIAVGWREWIGLPELGVKNIKVKVDTGARTSALHVSHVKVIKEARRKTVQFRVHPKQHKRLPQLNCESRLIDERAIKSSTGTVTLRPVIKTHLKVLDRTWPIEVTLVNRDMMGFRMLLGREAMRGKLVVDPSASFLLGKPKKKKSKE